MGTDTGLADLIEEIAVEAAAAALWADGWHFHADQVGDTPSGYHTGGDFSGWFKGGYDSTYLDEGEYEDTLDSWRTAIEEAFKIWREVPDPTGFNTPYQQLYNAAKLLSQGATVGDFSLPANVALSRIDTVQDQLQSMQGETIRACKMYYLDVLSEVTASECSAAAELAVHTAAEGVIWQGARDSLVEIGEAAKSQFKAIQGESPSSGSASVAFTVLGAVALVTGAFTGGLTTAALAAGGTVLQLAGSLTATDRSLSGSSPDDVLKSLTDRLDDLSSDIETEESLIQEKCYALSGKVGTDSADSYDLLLASRTLRRADRRNGVDLPTDILDADEESEFGGAGVIDVQHTTMVSTGQLMELLADPYTTSAQKLFGLSDTGPWERDYRIGCGVVGPFLALAASADVLGDAVKSTGLTLAEAGGQLRIAARFFSQTDARVEKAFDRHAKRFDKLTAPPPVPTMPRLGKVPIGY